MSHDKGQLVWAKLKYSAFWPAEIVDVPQQITKIPRNRICVRFFGTDNFGFVEAKNIKEYVENRTLFAHSGKGAAFKKALADIEEYISGKKVKLPAKNVGTIRVKTEDESNEIDIVQYNRAITPTNHSTNTNNGNDALILELSDVRKKYSDAIFQLHKSNESVLFLNEEKKSLLQQIDAMEQTVGPLKLENKVLNSRIDAASDEISVLKRDDNSWKNEKIRMQLSIDSYEQEKLTVLENVKAKDKMIGQLRKELKTLQSRLKQNQAGIAQNLRYFEHEDDEDDEDDENHYEVNKLLSHRNKKSKREFLVQWKESWVAQSNLNCPKILSAYLRQHKIRS